MTDYPRSLDPAGEPPGAEGDGVFDDAPGIFDRGADAGAAPADPRSILARRGDRRGRFLKHWLPGVIAVVIVLELLAPSGLRPSQLLGGAAAQFYGSIQVMGNHNQLSLEEERIITHMLAEREAEYGAWQGRCAMLILFDAQASAVCMAAADAFYSQAIDAVERRRQEMIEARR